MLVQRLDELLVQRVLVELIQNNFRYFDFVYAVPLEVSLDVLQLVGVALDKDEVEASATQVMSIRSANFGRSTVDDRCVLELLALLIFRRIRRQKLLAVPPSFEILNETLVALVKDVFADPVRAEAQTEVKKAGQINAWPRNREVVIQQR